MSIKNILDLFRNYNTNNDKVLSSKGLQNTDFINTIWSNCKYCKEASFIQGLSVEKYGTDNNTKGIQNIDDLPDAPTEGVKNACGIDISGLKLTDEQLLNLVIDDYTIMNDRQKTLVNAAKNNSSKIGLGVETLHNNGFKGTGTIALLDQKYCGHEMYNGRVISSTDKDFTDNPSWHTAAMLSIINKTAPDASIVHYNVTDEDTAVQDEQFANAIRDIIEKNKNLPDDKKIKTIVMGWGFYRDNPKYEEYIQLCREAVNNGIFIMSNNVNELYGIDIFGTNREALSDVNSATSYKCVTYNNPEACKGIDKKYLDKFLYLPQQHLTIANSDGKSIQYEGNDGGQCWTNAIGALYNDFLCIKPDLKPQEFVDLLLATSDEFIVDGIYCGRLLNAETAMKKLQ